MEVIFPENIDTNHAYIAKETTNIPHDGWVLIFKTGLGDTISQSRSPTNPNDIELRAGTPWSMAPSGTSGAINNKNKNKAKHISSRVVISSLLI
jgi:hypothetical protein